MQIFNVVYNEQYYSRCGNGYGNQCQNSVFYSNHDFDICGTNYDINIVLIITCIQSRFVTLRNIRNFREQTNYVFMRFLRQPNLSPNSPLWRGNKIDTGRLIPWREDASENAELHYHILLDRFSRIVHCSVHKSKNKGGIPFIFGPFRPVGPK